MTAQRDTEHAHCVYYVHANDRDCGCAIGVSLPRALPTKIVRVEANQPFIDVLVADLQLGGMFEDTDFVENLQAAHDGWCNAVREGDADEEWHKAQFLRLIGHPAAAAA